MPRAFLIHQQNKAKKAMADSTSPGHMDNLDATLDSPLISPSSECGEVAFTPALTNTSLAEMHLSAHRPNKRPLASILEPLQQTKKLRMEQNKHMGDNGREMNNNYRGFDVKHILPHLTEVKEEKCGETPLVMKSTQLLPGINKCSQYKPEIQSPSPPSKSRKLTPPRRSNDSKIFRNKDGVKGIKTEKDYRKSYLPHPYWSPLKIEVPHFEPSPDKLSAFNQQLQGGDQKIYFSPRRGNTSSPIEKPLFVDTLSRNQDRLSDSEHDSHSEKSPTMSDEEFYRESDSDSEVPERLGAYSIHKDNSRPCDTHKVVSPRKCPKGMLAPQPGASNLHERHSWQHNMHNAQMMDYIQKFTPMPAMRLPEYPLMAFPHYMTYLSALEKSGFPFMPSIWRPDMPMLVNPALIDPRYLQYQAEQLKCPSPAFTPPMYTPPMYPKPAAEKLEALHGLERPHSLDSNASDKLSTVSEESALSEPRPLGQTKHNCDWCGKTYSTFSGLTKHKQFHCSKHVTKQFNCQHCNKEYTSLGALKMHIRTHTLPCKCHICGKAFSRPWLLQGHIRTHTGEKPFSCTHCSRAFADRSNLRAHLQTHSDIKKYCCDTCKKSFSRMSLLVKHRDSGCPGH